MDTLHTIRTRPKLALITTKVKHLGKTHITLQMSMLGEIKVKVNTRFENVKPCYCVFLNEGHAPIAILPIMFACRWCQAHLLLLKHRCLIKFNRPLRGVQELHLC